MILTQFLLTNKPLPFGVTDPFCNGAMGAGLRKVDRDSAVRVPRERTSSARMVSRALQTSH